MIFADWSISFTSILAEYEWYETRKNSFYSFLSLFQSDQNLRFCQGVRMITAGKQMDCGGQLTMDDGTQVGQSENLRKDLVCHWRYQYSFESPKLYKPPIHMMSHRIAFYEHCCIFYYNRCFFSCIDQNEKAGIMRPRNCRLWGNLE